MKGYSKMSVKELREELLTALMAFYEEDPTDAIEALRDILADGSTGIPVNQMIKEDLVKELTERASN